MYKEKIACELVKIAKDLVSRAKDNNHNNMIKMQNDMADIKEKDIPEMLGKIKKNLRNIPIPSFDSIYDDRIAESQMEMDLAELRKLLVALENIEKNMN